MVERPNVALGASDAPNVAFGALDRTNATVRMWGRGHRSGLTLNATDLWCLANDLSAGPVIPLCLTGRGL